MVKYINMNTTHNDPFLSLAQSNDAEIDLSLGALLIAKDIYPELDTSVYMDQLDKMALDVKERIEK